MRQWTVHGRNGTARGGHPPGPRPADRWSLPRRSRLPALLTACSAVLLLPASPASATAPAAGEDDIRLVYCLDSAHRDDLVAAARRLGLLRAGGGPGTDSVRPKRSRTPMTVERWAERHEKDFARACSALMAADSGTPSAAGQDKGGDGWLLTFVRGLPLLLAGALLTVGGQMHERVSSERRQSRTQLIADEAAFRTSARTYLAAYEQDPHADHMAVRTARQALAGTLFRAPGPAARRRAARRVAEQLPLAEPLPASQGGRVLGTDARAGEARRAAEAVDGLLGAVAELDRSLVHWSLLTVRERNGRRTRGAAV